MRSDLARELRLAGAALRFLTRLPVPAFAWDPDWLPRSAKFFPLVGILVGAIAAAVLLAASRLWPQPVPALLAVAVVLLVTGALHEDGLADTADSLGGRTREARLAIMKDSRIGTFGAVALILCLALRAASLSVLPAAAAAAALVAAHAAGRLACVVLMARLPYAGERTLAKVEHGRDGPRRGEVAVAALIGLASFAALEPGRALPALFIGIGLTVFALRQAGRLFGGYTGDVLGAAEALVETGVLLGAAALPVPHP